ncbi:MAG: hypothetical protein U1E23_00200 [Reyranellaceae bacterium]
MIAARRLLLAAPLWLAASRLAAQSVWYAVRSADHSFIVDMPGEPVYKVLGASHSYSLESGSLSFVAQAAPPPTSSDASDPRRVLQGLLDERAGRLQGGRWAQSDWRSVQGTAAVESVGILAAGQTLRQLMTLRDRRLVTLACLGPADAVRGREANRFFASLRFP